MTLLYWPWVVAVLINSSVPLKMSDLEEREEWNALCCHHF